MHGLTIGACIQITEGKNIRSPEKKKIYKTEHAEHSDLNLLLSDSNNGIPKILYVHRSVVLEIESRSRFES
jgi:hypothetical protein